MDRRSPELLVLLVRSENSRRWIWIRRRFELKVNGLVYWNEKRA
jgi:hypothetical protein